MIVYVQIASDGEFLDENGFKVFDGFTKLGKEVIKFNNVEVLNLTKNDIVFGSVNTTLRAFDILGVKRPEALNYPDSLKSFLRREITECTLKDVLTEHKWPIFVKPKYIHKAFDGLVISEFKDILQLPHTYSDLTVLTSPVMRFKSEYRVYVIDDEIINISHYTGNPLESISTVITSIIVSAYSLDKNRPISYALDLGLNENGCTTIVEVNDFYALGSYGLDSLEYCRGIELRWKEIIG